MNEKNFPSVITLVTKNKIDFSICNKNLLDILKKYNVNIFKTKMLSLYVKDFFFNIDAIRYKILKSYLKDNNYKNADLCIQKSKYRKKKILACDMDMTAINVETIDLIGEKILNNTSMSNLTRKAMTGDISFSKSIKQRTKLLKGVKVRDIEKITKYIKPTKDVDTVIRTMNKNGCHTMLISGGYQVLASIIGQKIGFKEVISNRLISINGILNGNLENNIVDGKGKLDFFKKSIKNYKFNKEETLAVGDGENDIEIIKFASLGIAWKGFPNVKKKADVMINNSFKSILYFQGYDDKQIKN